MIKLFFNNKINTIGLLLAAAMTGSSSKKLTGTPANPPTAIPEAQQCADSARAMTAVAGIYSYTSFSSYGFMYNNAYFTACTGLSSDELTYTNTAADLLQFYNYGLTDLNAYASTLWSDPYTGLYAVNAVLNNV